VRGNRRLTDRPRPLGSNRSFTYANLISAVADEVAMFSAARHSGIPATSAVVPARAFGCGCAGLRYASALSAGTRADPEIQNRT